MATALTNPVLGQDVTIDWFNSISSAITEIQTNVPWIPLAFRSPWASYGGGWQLGQYRKILDDIVQIRGLIGRNAAATGSIADLPVGYRSTKNLMYLMGIGDPLTFTRLDVYPDGNVHVAGTLPGNWIYLNVQFSITA